MSDNINNLFQLTPEYVKDVCKVLGDAFQDDPIMVFTYPDAEERKKKAQYGFYMLYNYGIKNEFAYATSENLEGVTMWLPPGNIYISIWTMMKNGMFYTLRKVGLKMKAMKRTMAIFNYTEKRHKELVPYDHWYLQNIGVKPEEQGKGYGGHLLRTMINEVKSDGLPIYLETNTEKAMSIYQRYGFEILDHEIIPYTDVPLWCMLRTCKES